MSEAEGWASYAAEQERHAETAARLELMTREARLSREATEKAVRSRVSRHEIERALRAAGAPEDSMATDEDLLRYEGRAEAVAIVRDMLGLVGDTCRAPGYNGIHVAVGAGAVGSPPYVCHGCGGIFTPRGDRAIGGPMPMCVCGHRKVEHATTDPTWCLVRGGCDCHEYESC